MLQIQIQKNLIHIFLILDLCVIEKLVYKGFELDLLYRFAKDKGYKVNLYPLQEEGTGENRVIIGCQNITTDETHYFSNPIKNNTINLALRPDNIRNLLPFKILDENYQVKENNIIEIPVEINGEKKTSFCLFPDIYYNDTILMNCTINNITLNDSFDGNIKYEDSKDRIQILYSSIRVDNLLKANELFNDNTIIEQSNLNMINDKSSNSISNSSSNSISKFYEYKFFTKKKHLSTGAIIGIIVPCVVALVAIVILSLMCSKRPNINQNIPVNDISSVNVIQDKQ